MSDSRFFIQGVGLTATSRYKEQIANLRHDGVLVLNIQIENLDPDRFTLWLPPVGTMVVTGAMRHPVPLPAYLLPLHNGDLTDGSPSDTAIGQGVYDYLRQFPDCIGNTVYAELLRDVYPHFLSDLAAHAVMLDAKQVGAAYVVRKLTCLKILRLLEPQNRGLLTQLCRGYFELALDFAELSECRRHLREAMRFGQELLVAVPNDPQALSLLAEVDLLLGDMPAAIDKWRRLAGQVTDPVVLAQIDARIAACTFANCPETALVDDLEVVAEAMRLHTAGDDEQAAFLLDRLEENGRLTLTFPSADFYWLLGVCRQGSGNPGGAFGALQKALELEPDHVAASAVLAAL